jgi:hypothetical protein
MDGLEVKVVGTDPDPGQVDRLADVAKR